MDTHASLIVIVGPTASGKTSLSIELARRMGGEVISADSRQVYRGLDIGSGKVTKREMRGIPHHCLDLYSPRTVCSAPMWRKHAEQAYDEIRKRGHVPILAGGTGFYIDSFVFGHEYPAVPPDTALRQALGKLSPEELLARLHILDPERAESVEQKNPRRLIRAIEIAEALGKVPALVRTPRTPTRWIGIAPPKDVLREKIHSRLMARMRQGMVAEVRHLRAGTHQAAVSWERLESLGLEYRYIARYLRGRLTKEEMLEELEREIVRYARRQMTWFKRNKEIEWYESGVDALQECC